MATLNGNNVYLSWDGVQINGYWTGEVSKDETVNTVDITAGSGATHVERASGLIDNSLSFNLVYVEMIDNNKPLYNSGHMFDVMMETK